MKKRLGLGLGMFLITILSNLSVSYVFIVAIVIYREVHTIFVPVMLGIIYLASKGEVK